jgi:ElaB/YqjD/DUF883 family membrane-anchored ribosome-binding protein
MNTPTPKENPMSLQNIANSATHDAAAEIAKLREQVEGLMRDRVTPVIGQALHSAESAAKAAGDEMRHQAARLTGSVQEKPLAALALAAVAGFVLASLLRR